MISYRCRYIWSLIGVGIWSLIGVGMYGLL